MKGRSTMNKLPRFAANLRWFEMHKPQFARNIMHTHELSGSEARLLALVSPDRMVLLLRRMLDESATT